MSTKEMTMTMLDTHELSEEAMTSIYNFVRFMIEEAEDDVFCAKMVEDYLNDPDPNKHDSVTLEEAMKMCGITDDDLQNIN